jgi:hypothetical protein
MYADVANQIVHLIRYFGTFFALFYLLPKLMFQRPDGDSLERAAAMYLKMTLLVIATGYALVLLKLFEVLGLATVYALIAAYRIRKRRAEASARRLEQITVGTFDLLEGKLSLRERVLSASKAKAAIWTERALMRLRSPVGLWVFALLIVVFAAAAYIRMHDAVTAAPPALSDGNVTLEWMKYIDDRILFKSGIYPQGFHIVLDTIHKFASIDSIYVLKYSGPFNMLLVMLGMYLYVSRLSGNKAAGIVAAAAFGLLGEHFGGPIERQAAANSQEFAFVFVLPTLYFLHRFLKERQRDDIFVAGAGMAVTGLVHAVAFAFLGMGVAATMVYFLLTQGKRSVRPLLQVCAVGAAAVASALAPMGIGFLLGRGFHSSSVEYLAGRRDSYSVPDLTGVDQVALAALMVMGVSLLARIRRWRDLSAEWTALLVCGAAFALYYWGAVATENLVVATRSGELWALAVPAAIGLGVHLGLQPLLGGFRKTQLAIVTLVVAGLLALYPPQPIVPYKMTWNSSVEQYLRISTEFRPHTWMIVSKEDDYAVVYGSGFHLFMRDLLRDYDPKKPHLTKYGEDGPDKNVANDVFLYIEKTIFQVEETNSIYPLKAADYARWERETEQVRAWVDEHRRGGHPVEVYYEDDKLLVYHLHREPTREEIMDKIWGTESAD